MVAYSFPVIPTVSGPVSGRLFYLVVLGKGSGSSINMILVILYVLGFLYGDLNYVTAKL